MEEEINIQICKVPIMLFGILGLGLLTKQQSKCTRGYLRFGWTGNSFTLLPDFDHHQKRSMEKFEINCLIIAFFTINNRFFCENITKNYELAGEVDGLVSTNL